MTTPARDDPPQPRPASTTPVSAGEARVLGANGSARDIRRNIAASYGTTTVSMLLALVVTPVILHLLGPVLYGVAVLLISLTANVGLLDAGVSTAAVQLLSSALARNDRQRAEAILATAQVFFFATSILALAVVGALGLMLGSVFHLSGAPLGEVRVGLLLCGATLSVGLAATGAQIAIYGSGYSWRGTTLSIITPPLLYAGEIAVVLLGAGLVGYLSVPLALAVLQALWTRRIARRIGLVTPLRARGDRAVLGELLRSGWRNAVIAVAGTVSYQFDSSVISAVRSAQEVTPYGLGSAVAGFPRAVATTGTSHLLPTFAHSAALGDRERQYVHYTRAVLASLLIASPLVVALIALGRPLLHLWLGSVPPHTYGVLVLACVYLLLQLPGGQTFVFMTGAGRNRTLVRFALPLALLNLGISVAATFFVGPLGPVVGGLPQAAVFEFVILPVVACRILAVPFGSYIRDALWVPAVALAAATGAAAVVRSIGDTSLLAAAPEAVFVTLVGWASGLALLLARDQGLRAGALGALRALRRRHP
jgi:O-antigen/teichoic acid export membrane protein